MTVFLCQSIFDFCSISSPFTGQTIKSAQERSKDVLEAREREQEKAEEEKKEKKKLEKEKQNQNTVKAPETKKSEPEPEDDFAGPAIPAGFVPTVFKQPTKVTKESDSSDSDSSDSDSSDSEDEDSGGMVS